MPPHCWARPQDPGPLLQEAASANKQDPPCHTRPSAVIVRMRGHMVTASSMTRGVALGESPVCPPHQA